MKEINNFVQEYILKRERSKRYIAVLLSLSMLVTFIVPSILIEPAVSQTKNSFAPVGDILPAQLFNAGETYMVQNMYGQEGNTPKELSEATLLLGYNENDWRKDLLTAEEAIEAAREHWLLGIAGDFCVFLNEDFIVFDSDSEGRVAVGGNFDGTDSGYYENDEHKSGNYQVGAGDWINSRGDTEVTLNNTDNYEGISNYAHLIVGGRMMKNLATYTTWKEGKEVVSTSNGDRYKRFLVSGNFSLDERDSNNELCNVHYNTQQEEVRYDAGSHKHWAASGEFSMSNEHSQIYQTKTDNPLIDFESEFNWLKSQSTNLSKVTMSKGAEIRQENDGEKIIFDATNVASDADVVYFTIDSWGDWKNIEFVNIPWLDDEPSYYTDGSPKCANIIVNCLDGGSKQISVSTNKDRNNPITINNAITINGNNSNDDIHNYVETTINGVVISNNNNKNGTDSNNPTWTNNTKASESLLYNFPNANSIFINTNFNGTIFAPEARVYSDPEGKGHLSGSLIAKSFTGGLEFGYRPYRGSSNLVNLDSGYVFPIDKVDGNGNLLSGAVFNVTTHNNTTNKDDIVYSWRTKDRTEFVRIDSGVDYTGNTQYDATQISQQTDNNADVEKEEATMPAFDILSMLTDGDELVSETETSSEETSEESSEASEETSETSEEIEEGVVDLEAISLENVNILDEGDEQQGSGSESGSGSAASKVSPHISRTYTVSEISAPYGYIPSSETITITIDETVNSIGSGFYNGQSVLIPVDVTADLTMQKESLSKKYRMKIDDQSTTVRIIKVYSLADDDNEILMDTFKFTFDSNGTGKKAECITSVKRKNGDDYETFVEYDDIQEEGDKIVGDKHYYYTPGGVMVVPLPINDNASEFVLTNKKGLRFNKADQYGDPVKGADIELYEGGTKINPITEEAPKANTIGWTWDDNTSTFLFDPDKLGSSVYRLHEKEAPKSGQYDVGADIYFQKCADGSTIQYWMVDSNNNDYYINADGEKVFGKCLLSDATDKTVKMVDFKKTGANIKLEKISNDAANAKLPDTYTAKFDLYRDDTGNGYVKIKEDIEVTQNGLELKNVTDCAYIDNGYLLPGDYCLIETAAPAGFAVYAEPFYFQIADNFPFNVTVGEPVYADLTWDDCGNDYETWLRYKEDGQETTLNNVEKIVLFFESSANGNIQLWGEGYNGQIVDIINGKAIIPLKELGKNNFSSCKLIVENVDVHTLSTVRIYTQKATYNPVNIEWIKWSENESNSNRPIIESLTFYYNTGEPETIEKSDTLNIGGGSDNWQQWNLNNMNSNNVVGITIVTSGENKSGQIKISESGYFDTPKTLEGGKTYNLGNVPTDKLEPAIKEGEDNTIQIPNAKVTDYVNLTLMKAWEDKANKYSSRPVKLTVTLKRSKNSDGSSPETVGTYTLTAENNLTVENNWKLTLNGKTSDPKLYRYDADDNNAPWYYFFEETVPANYTAVDGGKTEVKNEGTFNLSNKLKKECSMTARKEWETGSDVSKVVSLTFELQRQNGSNWEYAGEKKYTISNANPFNIVFNDLPADQTWRIIEKDVPAGWCVSYSKDTSDNSIIVIKNSPDIGSLKLKKEWSDENSGNQPDDVKVALYRVPKPVGLYPSQEPEKVQRDYARLLEYSLYFYDANMCGDDVTGNSAYSWRGNCHSASDKGYNNNMITGGYHDAGDHTMFGLPQGFAASTLGWAYYEFTDSFTATGQSEQIQKHLKRFNELFANAFDSTNNRLLVQRGDVGTDQGYANSPEGQQKSNYGDELWKTDEGSNVACEYAASLALYALNFPNDSDSTRYLAKAVELYEFAKRVNRVYSLPNYTDDEWLSEKAWAEAWLYMATKDAAYKFACEETLLECRKPENPSNLSKCRADLGDNKAREGGYYWGFPLLGAEVVYQSYLNKDKSQSRWALVDSYLEKETRGVKYNDNTSLTKLPNASGQDTYVVLNNWGSCRTSTHLQTLAMIAAKHGNRDYSSWCKAQMAYILGDNKIKSNGNDSTCFVSGFAENSGRNQHHRAASGNINGGTTTNLMIGALIGGPNSHGEYSDKIITGGAPDSDCGTDKSYVTNEVTVDYNAGLVGAAAGLYDYYHSGCVYEIPRKYFTTSVSGLGGLENIFSEQAVQLTGSQENMPEGVVVSSAGATVDPNPLPMYARSSDDYNMEVPQMATFAMNLRKVKILDNETVTIEVNKKYTGIEGAITFNQSVTFDTAKFIFDKTFGGGFTVDYENDTHDGWCQTKGSDGQNGNNNYILRSYRSSKTANSLYISGIKNDSGGYNVWDGDANNLTLLRIELSDSSSQSGSSGGTTGGGNTGETDLGGEPCSVCGNGCRKYSYPNKYAFGTYYDDTINDLPKGWTITKIVFTGYDNDKDNNKFSFYNLSVNGTPLINPRTSYPNNGTLRIDEYEVNQLIGDNVKFILNVGNGEKLSVEFHCQPPQPEGMTVSPNPLAVTVGTPETLTISNCESYSYDVTSGNDVIGVTKNANGTLTVKGKKAGNAVIKIVEGNDITDTAATTIEVQVTVTGISLSMGANNEVECGSSKPITISACEGAPTFEIKVGDTYKTITDTDGIAISNVTNTSATITGNKAGTYIIRATDGTNTGNISADFEVEVKAKAMAVSVDNTVIGDSNSVSKTIDINGTVSVKVENRNFIPSVLIGGNTDVTLTGAVLGSSNAPGTFTITGNKAGNVTVRITDASDPTKYKDIELKIEGIKAEFASAVSAINVGGTATINVAPSATGAYTYSVSPDGAVTFANSGNTLTVTGAKAGKATITITDNNTNYGSKTLELTVNGISASIGGNTNVGVSIGNETGELVVANCSDWEILYKDNGRDEYSNASTVVSYDPATRKFTAGNTEGSTVVMVRNKTYLNDYSEITITVSDNLFKAKPNELVFYGDYETKSIDFDNCSDASQITYSSTGNIFDRIQRNNNQYDVQVNNNAGSGTITFTYNGVSSTVHVIRKKLRAEIDNSTNADVSVGDTFEVTVHDYETDVEYNTSDYFTHKKTETKTVGGEEVKVLTFTASKPGNNIQLTVKDSNNRTVSVQVNISKGTINIKKDNVDVADNQSFNMVTDQELEFTFVKNAALGEVKYYCDDSSIFDVTVDNENGTIKVKAKKEINGEKTIKFYIGTNQDNNISEKSVKFNVSKRVMVIKDSAGKTVTSDQEFTMKTGDTLELDFSNYIAPLKCDCNSEYFDVDIDDTTHKATITAKKATNNNLENIKFYTGTDKNNNTSEQYIKVKVNEPPLRPDENGVIHWTKSLDLSDSDFNTGEIFINGLGNYKINKIEVDVDNIKEFYNGEQVLQLGLFFSPNSNGWRNSMGRDFVDDVSSQTFVFEGSIPNPLDKIAIGVWHSNQAKENKPTITEIRFYVEPVTIIDPEAMITINSNYTFTATRNADWTACWEDTDHTPIAISNAKGTDSIILNVSERKAANIKITANGNLWANDKETITVKCVGEDYAFPSSIQLRAGSSYTFASIDGVTLSFEGTYTGVEFDPENSNKINTDANITEPVNVIVKALREDDGLEKTCTVSVVPGISVDNLVNGTLVVGSNSKPIDVWNVIGSLTVVDDNELVSVRNKRLVINNCGTSTITIKDDNGTASDPSDDSTLTFTIVVKPVAAVINTEDMELVDYYTLEANKNWSLQVDDLDKQYNYYIVELNESQSASDNNKIAGQNNVYYVPTSYDNNNGYGYEALKNEPFNTLSVKNSPTTVEEKGTEMPSTGGTGTAPYRVIGIVIMGGALAAFAVKKRRDEDDE